MVDGSNILLIKVAMELLVGLIPSSLGSMIALRGKLCVVNLLPMILPFETCLISTTNGSIKETTKKRLA